MPSFRLPYLSVGHIRISLGKLGKILTSQYWVYSVWIFFSLTTLFILLWLPNLSLLTRIMTSDLSTGGKLDFLASTPEILSTSYTPFRAGLLIAIAFLQGLVISLLVVYWRNNKKADTSTIAASGAGVSLAALGASCSACGAGVLYPVLASLGVLSVSSASAFEIALMMGAIVVLLYSLHRTTLLIT